MGPHRACTQPVINQSVMRWCLNEFVISPLEDESAVLCLLQGLFPTPSPNCSAPASKCVDLAHTAAHSLTVLGACIAWSGKETWWPAELPEPGHLGPTQRSLWTSHFEPLFHCLCNNPGAFSFLLLEEVCGFPFCLKELQVGTLVQTEAMGLCQCGWPVLTRSRKPREGDKECECQGLCLKQEKENSGIHCPPTVAGYLVATQH